MIKLSGPTFNFIEKRLPVNLKDRLNRYTNNAQSASATKDWQQLIKVSMQNAVIYSVLLVSIILAASKYLLPIISNNFGDRLSNIITSIITLASMSPFLWALIARNHQSELRSRLVSNERYKGLVYIVSLVKLGLAVFFVIFMLRIFFSDGIAAIATIVIFALLIAFRKRIQRFYRAIEDRFKTNLNAKEIEQEENDCKRTELAPWDAHIATIKVPANSPIIGKKLKELMWRESAGVNISSILRGNHNIRIPNAEEYIYPFDELSIIGTDEQLAIIKDIITPKNHIEFVVDNSNVSLQALTITEDSLFIGQTIRDSGIKTKVKGLVVGIERDGERHLNPESTWILQENDIVWLAGDTGKINKLIG